MIAINVMKYWDHTLQAKLKKFLWLKNSRTRLRRSMTLLADKKICTESQSCF